MPEPSATPRRARTSTGAIDLVGESAVRPGDLDPATAGTGSRRRVMATGLVVEVTVPPVTGVQNFTALLEPECALEPGSGPAEPRALRLVWQGRRGVPGVGAGTRLRCVGVVSFRDGRPTMFNPRYEIIAKQISR
ncbi:hypothetical protein ACH9EU_09740 [Kocuria sp. M1R5S2]|uniref:hypothetical protein n=1 Tax=Kocuria rhizosphaerae TaxID=3376285 RepID=UPI0037A10CBA